jgi:general nucleoside transport system ATP-binding protein
MHVALHGLTRTFGNVRANDGLSLSFGAGRIHAVLGENGAGKSTMMKILSGFLSCDAGEIVLDGQRVQLHSPDDALRAGVGMVYQDPLDVPAFTALENFSCGASRQRFPSQRAARQQLQAFAETLGFEVPPDIRVGQLTVGQRQQLEIVRLLAWGARVLILDEPTTGITASQKQALFAALRRMAAEGHTVLFVTHKLEEVAELCHTVSVLRAGRVVGDGTMEMPQPQERLLSLMFGEGDGPPATFSNHVQSFVPSLPHPVWRLEHVTVREGALELRDLSLDIRAGMVLGLAGLDGSGQQVLLRLLAGVVRPQSGQLFLNGKNFTTAALAEFQADGVQYLPADRLNEGVIGDFSLADHIALIRPHTPLLPPRRSVRAKARALIEEYAIRATPDSPIESLSGGNQQRAMLALLPPRCTGLLLEQPTRGLDVTSALGIWGRLQARCADGTALVFTSADLDEVLEYSDDVLVFFGGRVSSLLPRSTLSTARLAVLIGGVGFDHQE